MNNNVATSRHYCPCSVVDLKYIHNTQDSETIAGQMFLATSKNNYIVGKKTSEKQQYPHECMPNTYKTDELAIGKDNL